MKSKRYCSFASLSLVVIDIFELVYVFDDYKLAIELSWILLNVAYMMEFVEELRMSNKDNEFDVVWGFCFTLLVV